MKKLKFFVPAFFMAILIAGGIYQLSCSKENSKFLFGRSEESPLKTDEITTKAVDIQGTFRKIFSQYKDSVVYITTEQIVKVRNPLYSDPILRNFFGSPGGSKIEKRRGLGTGFILSENGYVCTNHHVINGMDTVHVKVDEINYEARIIGSDAQTDIALLKIDPRQKLKPIYLGDSDKVEVGDWAVAIGNPFGLDRTFTVGVISAKGRRDVDFMGGSHLQTDASINPGNSGGPLINIYGEVIGINRMIYSKSGGYMGIGFAIPMNTAKMVLEQLLKYQRVKRGYIGVSIIPLSRTNALQLGLKKNEGAFIGEVMPGGPAQRGGLKVGDVIIKINGQEIKSIKNLTETIGEAKIGDTISVTVWRNHALKKIFITIQERPRQ